MVEPVYLILQNWQDLILLIVAIYVSLSEAPNQLALYFAYDDRAPHKVDREICIGLVKVVFQHNDVVYHELSLVGVDDMKILVLKHHGLITQHVRDALCSQLLEHCHVDPDEL